MVNSEEHYTNLKGLRKSSEPSPKNSEKGKKLMSITNVVDKLGRTACLEITTNIGCPANCRNLCPQEILLNRYEGPRLMSLDMFKTCLKTVPPSVEILFSGFSEPFANPDAISMIEHAAQNHTISVFTTLMCASEDSVKRLGRLEYNRFCLHVPDGVNCRIPLTEEYMRNFFYIVEHVRNVYFTTMNKRFHSNNRENVTRGKLPRAKPVQYCDLPFYPDFVLLPNGNVQLCCMDFGLKHTVGNLERNSYESIRADFWKRRKKFALCRYCSWNISYLAGVVLVAAKGTKPIKLFKME